LQRFYYYKLTVDDGGAPCVQNRMLSLAICKPMIRSTAKPNDLIFGFAANSLHADNRLLYIARVTQKVVHGNYYASGRFARRADCIYERREGRFWWRSGALYHGAKDIGHDLGEHPDYLRANVLLSTDFRYFGTNGTAAYKARFPLINEAIEALGQGHRVFLMESLRQKLKALKDEVWKDARQHDAGQQTSAPRCGISHRSRSCGVLDDADE